MTVVIPDNRKKYQLFNRTSAMNLVFLFLWNLKALKDLDLPAIFGKQ